MPRGLLLPDRDPDAVATVAERGESLGYDSLWAGELWGRDAFLTLGRVAAAVGDVALGTAIVNVYSRTPAVLAQAVATLDSLADGEVRLGIGPSTRKAVTDLHGMAFENPARRMHETADLVHAFTAGEGRVDYDGEVFDVADFPALDADVPVYAASLGAATRRMTGRTADGWLPHNVPFSRLETAFDTIRDAAHESGRDPDTITVSPYVPCAVSDDAETARETARGHLAYYVGSGEGYRRSVATRFPDAADEVAAAWRDGDRSGARAAVTDEMLADLTVCGTPEEARDRFDALADRDLVDEPLVVVPSNASEAVFETTVETLAP